LSTISLGKSVNQESKPNRGKLVWEFTIILESQCFCMNNKQREENKSFEMEKPWRVNYGVYLEQKTEELCCQAWKVNSCVSCTIIASDCCYFPSSELP
jgi:hypothetical protein